MAALLIHPRKVTQIIIQLAGVYTFLYSSVYTSTCRFTEHAMLNFLTDHLLCHSHSPKNAYLCLCVTWCVCRHGLSYTSEYPQQQRQQLQGADYEEPLEGAIPLSDNQAYGHNYRHVEEEVVMNVFYI